MVTILRDFVIGLMQAPAGDVESLSRLWKGVGSAGLVVLPEYSNAVPGEDGGVEAAEWLSVLSSLARERGVHILAGVLEENGNCRYSSVVHVKPDGSWSVVHRKYMLFRALGVDESRHLCRGRNPPPVLDLGFARIGVIVCYEMRFPELVRNLALRGAEIIVVPSAWYPGPLKEDHFVTLARCRALDNTVYVAAVNQPAPRFTGRSLLVTPWGVTRVQLGTGPEYIEVRVEGSVLREARERLPVLRDALELADSTTRRV
ncbi:nitrilase-related carbon-nitrogen hydrolase [Pyrolobus fumarii]|nr:nitrilase-related carbon-nitrogen hydrolase [Pyrolobus fumarii]